MPDTGGQSKETAEAPAIPSIPYDESFELSDESMLILCGDVQIFKTCISFIKMSLKNKTSYVSVPSPRTNCGNSSKRRCFLMQIYAVMQ